MTVEREGELEVGQSEFSLREVWLPLAKAPVQGMEESKGVERRIKQSKLERLLES